MTETVIRKHPWLGYPIIFLCIILLYFVIIRFNLLHTNVESARYMLSALVQSEAAIIAIVVTLSLVVVQLTASFYSAKITKIFRKSPDLWILMISYISAMIYSLVVLLMIEEVNSVLNIEKHIIFSLFLGIFCFLALLYTHIMLIMLRTSTIIGKLSRRINKNSLLKEDPVYPIVDIVIGSMKKDDFRTVRDGMGAIGNRIRYIHKTEELTKGEDQEISSRLFDHILRVCQLAIDKDDEDSAEIIMREVLEIGRTAIDERHYVPVGNSADFFVNVGKRAAGRCLKWTTGRAVFHLGVLGHAAVRGKLQEIAKISTEGLKTLRDIAKKSHVSCAPTDAGWLEVAENATGWIERVETEIR